VNQDTSTTVSFCNYLPSFESPVFNKRTFAPQPVCVRRGPHPSHPLSLRACTGVSGACGAHRITTWQYAQLPIAFERGGGREFREWIKAINNATTLNTSHEKLFTFFEDLWSLWRAKKIDQNYFWLSFGLQLVSKYHRSLSLILGVDVTVGIFPRKDVFCRDFILCAVATFWAMSLVGIYPGRASWHSQGCWPVLIETTQSLWFGFTHAHTSHTQNIRPC